MYIMKKLYITKYAYIYTYIMYMYSLDETIVYVKRALYSFKFILKRLTNDL